VANLRLRGLPDDSRYIPSPAESAVSRWLFTLRRCSPPQLSPVRTLAVSIQAEPIRAGSVRAVSIRLGRHQRSERLRYDGPQDHPGMAGVQLDLVDSGAAGGSGVAFGGFERRTDLLKTVPPGALITTGPYEFRFTEATAQHKKDFDGSLYWEVVMIGEGRTTGNESISPSYMAAAGCL
jgi:hypothetical protein